MTQASLDAALGHSPMRNTLVELGIVIGGTVIIMAVCLAIHVVVAFIMGFLLAIAWMFQALPIYFGKLIGAGVHGKQYQAAKKAVADGQISVGLVGRNRLCQGIVIVDEPRRQAYINGRIFEFSEIGSLVVRSKRTGRAMYDETWIEIMLRDPARTILSVYFDDGTRADQFSRQFRSVLGMA